MSNGLTALLKLAITSTELDDLSITTVSFWIITLLFKIAVSKEKVSFQKTDEKIPLLAG